MSSLRRTLQLSVILVCLVTCVTILPAAVLQPSPPGWAPQWLRYWAADVRLTVGTPAKKALSLGRINVPDLRVYRGAAEETVRIHRGELTFVGALSRPAIAAPHPAVLLLHGSTAEGRKLGLYRLLTHELVARGYMVLSLDQRGFGDSDDPTFVDRPDAFDYIGDAKHAVDYLSTLPGVDTTRLVLLGHSLGASFAIAAGLDHPRVWKIVAIGPPRRFAKRVETEQEYRQRRAMRMMRLREMIPADVFLRYRNATNIERFGPQLVASGHKPLLLIDGGQEGAADRRFIEMFVRDSVTEPKAHIRLATGDHYANVLNIGSLVLYDRRVLNELVEGIDSWLRAD